MGSLFSKEVTDKEKITPEFIENRKNDVDKWQNFTEKTVKNVFEESLSRTGVNKNDRDGLLKRIYGLLRLLGGFITSGFGAFYDRILGCCLGQTPREMMDAQFAGFHKESKDLEKKVWEVLAKLDEIGGNIFCIVVATIMAFFRGIMDWIKWFFQKIVEFVENCVEFITNAIRSLFNKTEDLLSRQFPLSIDFVYIQHNISSLCRVHGMFIFVN